MNSFDSANIWANLILALNGIGLTFSSNRPTKPGKMSLMSSPSEAMPPCLQIDAYKH